MEKVRRHTNTASVPAISPNARFTVRQVADGLMVTPLTVYKWISGHHAGPPLPTTDVPPKGVTPSGRQSVYIREPDLMEWLAACRPDIMPLWYTRNSRNRGATKLQALVEATILQQSRG